MPQNAPSSLAGLSLLFSIASVACSREPTVIRPEPAVEAPPASPPGSSLAPRTIGELLDLAIGRNGEHAFVSRGSEEPAMSCQGGVPLCQEYCLGWFALCTIETYRAGCENEPVYPPGPATQRDLPVECTPDRRRCWATLVSTSNPQPQPRIRHTFYFAADGALIGLDQTEESSRATVDPEATLARTDTMCRWWEAFERGELAPTERLGRFTSIESDLGENQRRDHESHVCGPGVRELVARDVAELVELGGFDNCALGEPFTCWVFGTEARTVYYADNIGTDAEPRFAVFAIATEGLLLDDPAPQQARIDAFLARARSGPSVRSGPVRIPADLRASVRACR
jgi:hypothetical protein